MLPGLKQCHQIPFSFLTVTTGVSCFMTFEWWLGWGKGVAILFFLCLYSPSALLFAYQNLFWF